MDHHDLAKVLDTAAQNIAQLEVRFACLATAAVSADGHVARDRQLELQGLCSRLRVPVACRDLAALSVRTASELRSINPASAEALYEFVERADGFRQPERFASLLEALRLMATVSPLSEGAAPVLDAIQHAYRAATRVDAKVVAREALIAGLQGTAVGEAIKRARVAAIEAVAGP